MPKYCLWQCDDGTYDICDQEREATDFGGNIVYTNVKADVAYAFMEQAEQIEKLQSAIDVLVRLQLSDMKYSDTALP